MNDSLILNNRSITFEQIKDETAVGETDFEEATIGFCRQWLNGQASFSLKTSGSTGEPKTIKVSRDQMVASARQTIDFFNLTPEDTVLVCLNTAYIAGIMMLVRGFKSGAKIIATEPQGNPLLELEQPIDLIAVVPLQLSQILQSPDTKTTLEKCRATIVGGAPVSFKLEQEIESTQANIWATFGMTETLTHFALRQLSPTKEKAFTVLNNTSIRLDERGCLAIASPVTQNQEVVTNDLVELYGSQKFKWLGRIDNVINTGGIKLQIEALEEKTQAFFQANSLDKTFFIGKTNDDKLGEAICLVIEGESEVEKLITTDWEPYFTSFERPKTIKYLPRFVYTPTGKINRNATMQLVKLLA